MNPKALMFAVFGLIVFGSLTMVWVGHDMNSINADRRAQLAKQCTSGAPAMAIPGTSATGGSATATSAPEDPAKFAQRCAKIGITVSPASATDAASLENAGAPRATSTTSPTGAATDASTAQHVDLSGGAAAGAATDASAAQHVDLTGAPSPATSVPMETKPSILTDPSGGGSAPAASGNVGVTIK